MSLPSPLERSVELLCAILLPRDSTCSPVSLPSPPERSVELLCTILLPRDSTCSPVSLPSPPERSVELLCVVLLGFNLCLFSTSSMLPDDLWNILLEREPLDLALLLVVVVAAAAGGMCCAPCVCGESLLLPLLDTAGRCAPRVCGETLPFLPPLAVLCLSRKELCSLEVVTAIEPPLLPTTPSG